MQKSYDRAGLVKEWLYEVGLTAQNPRRHAAGKPFHAFLIGWLGGASPRSDSGKGYVYSENGSLVFPGEKKHCYGRPVFPPSPW